MANPRFISQSVKKKIKIKKVNNFKDQPSILELILTNKKAFIGLIMVLTVIIVAILAPLITPYDPAEMHVGPLLQSPNCRYLMGTDIYGRDVFSRVVYGTRISLLVGIFVGGTAAFLGSLLGLFAGYYGGLLDNLIMRFADTLFSFPWVLTAIILATIVGPGLTAVLIALPIVYTPQFIRLIRGIVLSLREKEYVEAAKISGEKNISIIFLYILPNCIGPLIVQITIIMSVAILGEAAISYLGLGTQPPTPSWGLMLSEASDFLMVAPYLSIFPGISIMFTVIGFNFLGDGLGDIFNPQYRTGL